MRTYDRTDFTSEHCQPFLLEGNDEGVLLIHGFTGTAAHMRPLGEALHGSGYTVKGINLPGHALSERAMKESGWQDWLQASKEAVLEMLRSCRKVTVCGLSMGGVLALLVAEQMRVDACVTISAPMAVRDKLIGLAGLAAPFYPRVAAKVDGHRRDSLDQAYDFGYAGFPTRKAVDLNRLIRLARQNLFSVNCPILCVQSDADRVIWSGSADYILGNVSSAFRQKLELRGVPHVCTISGELPAIVRGMEQFLNRG